MAGFVGRRRELAAVRISGLREARVFGEAVPGNWAAALKPAEPHRSQWRRDNLDVLPARQANFGHVLGLFSSPCHQHLRCQRRADRQDRRKRNVELHP